MGSSGDLALRVVLQASDLASGTVRGFGSVISGLSGPAGVAIGALLAVASAVVGIGAKAIQMAGQYDQSLRMVQSLTGASSDQMAYYDTQLKQLAMDAGVAPNNLAQGLYQVISAGYSGAQAMNILTLSTKDSKIGMTDAKVTAEALTNVLANFSWQTKDANLVNGQMLETVTLGKATFQQYASTITKAATVSQQYKISLETMSAAWATMTANGISAGKASTDYQQVVGLMYGKVGTLTKSLQKNGIAFNEAQFNSDTFGQKILYLNQLLQEAAKKHVQLTGVTLQSAQAITVIAGHMGVYNNNLKTLSDHQAMAQKTSQAWAITQGGFNQTMSRLGATVQVLLIDIGQQLLPVLTRIAQAVLPVISGFATWITKSGIVKTGLDLLDGGISKLLGFIGGLVTGIGNVISFFQKNQVAALALLIPLGMIGAVLTSMAVSAIASAIAAIPTLITGFIAWAIAAGSAAIATLAATWPLLLIGAAIGILIGIIILLVNHWKQVVSFLQGIWKHITQFFHDDVVVPFQNLLHGLATFFSNIWNNIVGFFKSHIALIISIVTGPLGALVVLIVTHWNQIKDFFTNLWKNVTSIFQKAKDWVMTAVNNLWTNIKNFFTGLPAQALQWGKDMIQGFINGIKNMAGALWQQIQNIGNNIKSFLHFSKPDTGPLADADKWMPDMMNMMTQGIIAGNPKLQAAVQTTARVIAGASTPPARSQYGSIPYGQPPISSNSSYSAGGNTMTHNGDIVIHAGPGMNTKDLAKEVVNQISREYRRSGSMGNPAAGLRSV